MKPITIIDASYSQWIEQLSQRYRRSQIKAALKVNSEMIAFYWSLGRDIVQMQFYNKYGSGFYRNLSSDLAKLLPDVEGLSDQFGEYGRMRLRHPVRRDVDEPVRRQRHLERHTLRDDLFRTELLQRPAPESAVEKTEADLKKAFSPEEWEKRHLQIIYFGRNECKARGHKVENCPICSVVGCKR